MKSGASSVVLRIENALCFSHVAAVVYFLAILHHLTRITRPAGILNSSFHGGAAVPVIDGYRLRRRHMNCLWDAVNIVTANIVSSAFITPDIS